MEKAGETYNIIADQAEAAGLRVEFHDTAEGILSCEEVVSIMRIVFLEGKRHTIKR